jgi:hypothetical protein
MVSEPQVKTESLVQSKPQACCQMSDSGSQSLNFDGTNLLGLGLGVDAETSLASWEHDLVAPWAVSLACQDHAGGRTSLWAGTLSCLTTPTGQVIPFGPWLQ